MNDQCLPFAGVRVLEVGQYIAGPGTTQLLSDLGARVTKIEPLEGESARHIGAYGTGIIRAFNRDKRVLRLDLRSRAGVSVIDDLVTASDVFVQNLKPGSAESLGLGVERLHAINPRLVFASVSGYGRRRGAEGRPGLDIAAQAESGMMSITGETGRDPQRVGFPVVDTASTYVLALGVAAALFERERGGSSLAVDTSLLDVGLHLQSAVWGELSQTGVEPMRKGNGQPSAAPAADVIDVDGGHIVVSAYTRAHWASLCEALGRADLRDRAEFRDNPSRVANRDALLAEISGAMAGLTGREAVALLRRHGVVAAQVRTYDQVIEADAAEPESAFTDAVMEGETYRVPKAPLRFTDPDRRTAESRSRQGVDIVPLATTIELER